MSESSLDSNVEAARTDATVTTYVYLRVSFIAAVLLVFAALAFQIIASRELLNSISHYYYTPVRSVFVGALVGMGLGLIALSGRPGLEDTALNLAGMLAPVVAFVPTPVDCGRNVPKCIPEEFVPGVVNNIAALLMVGLVALGFAAMTLRRLHRGNGWSKWGFIVAGLLWVGALLWFGFTDDWASRASFLRFAHYGAAVPMFALIIVVVFINGFRSTEAVRIAGRNVSYRPVYHAIAVAMAVVVLIGLSAWIGTRSDEDPPEVIFWVEAILLLLFGVFWALQTWEFRKTGPPLPG